VRPSSLNYKISLLEATASFVLKDKQADQVVEVELEELPTCGGSLGSNKAKLQNYEILDDALYTINKTAIAKLAINTANTTNLTKAKQNAAASAAWEREEEVMRKKLERNQLNMMKNKMA
jgi:hypothetical protein